MRPSGILTRLRVWFLRRFFSRLYGPMAWVYDAFAAAVSMGLWRGWVLSVRDDLPGPSVLELGSGPGHLLLALRRRGRQAWGVDLSPQMTRLAARRLRRAGFPPVVVNGYAQDLPFSGGAFEQVVATFPAEYLWEAATLAEIHRVLTPDGACVILLVAWITGSAPWDRAAAWLFRVTGQAPDPLAESWPRQVRAPFARAGFHVRVERRTLKRSRVLVLIAHKAHPHDSRQSSTMQTWK